MSSTTASARARLPLAWTITCRPSAASWRQIAPPRSPLPPVTRARRGVVGCLSMRGIIAGLRRGGALPSPCRRRGRGKGKSSRLKPLLHGRTQHHRGAAFGQEGAGVVDAEAILLAALGLDQHFGLALERAGQIVDAGGVQLHAAQCDQQARFRRAAGLTRAQAAVQGERERTRLNSSHKSATLPPSSPRIHTLLPYPPLFRSYPGALGMTAARPAARRVPAWWMRKPYCWLPSASTSTSASHSSAPGRSSMRAACSCTPRSATSRPGFAAPPASRARRPPCTRSEERRVGKERVRTCSSRWSPYH